MASLKEIRGRIKSAKNIQQITKAMKMVAAARLRRGQERIWAARPFAVKIAAVIRDIAGRSDTSAQPLLRPHAPRAREAGRTTLHLVVVAADKGLCGAFNVNVLRRASQIIRENQDTRDVKVTVIGRKARDFFRRFNVELVQAHVNVFAGLNYAFAETVARELEEAFLSGAADEVVLLYTEYKSTITLKVTEQRLLPFQVESLESDGAKLGEYLFEPGQEQILAALLPRAVGMQVWRALLESQASEFAARMTAMDSATRNSKEMIGALTLKANRIRQAAITKEIAELVGGAEALK